MGMQLVMEAIGAPIPQAVFDLAREVDTDNAIRAEVAEGRKGLTTIANEHGVTVGYVAQLTGTFL